MKKTLLITAFLSAFITLNSCKQSSSASSENSADPEKLKTDGTNEEHKITDAPKDGRTVRRHAT